MSARAAAPPAAAADRAAGQISGAAADLPGRPHSPGSGFTRLGGVDAIDEAENGTAAANPLTAPFEKLRDHAPDDPAFFLEHLSRSVFEAGINWRVVVAKWDGIREAFHGFDPAQVAAMSPAEIAAVENDSRVIRNKAKIRATVENAREVLALLDQYGSIRGYLASFPDAGAAAADMRRRFKFLGDTGIWRLLTSASRDIG